MGQTHSSKCKNCQHEHKDHQKSQCSFTYHRTRCNYSNYYCSKCQLDIDDCKCEDVYADDDIEERCSRNCNACKCSNCDG